MIHSADAAPRRRELDVDFGSPFPGAVAPAQRITRSGGTPQARARSPQKATTPPPPAPAAIDANTSANTSAKRRRLEVAQDVPPSSSTRSTRSRAVSTPRRDIFDLGEDEPSTEVGEQETPDQAIRANAAESSELPSGSGQSQQITTDGTSALEREQRRRERLRGAQ